MNLLGLLFSKIKLIGAALSAIGIGVVGFLLTTRKAKIKDLERKVENHEIKDKSAKQAEQAVTDLDEQHVKEVEDALANPKRDHFT